MYNNWKPRQRGFLTQDGEWDIIIGTEKRPCYCQKRLAANAPGCHNIFNPNGNAFRGGQWSARVLGRLGQIRFSRQNVQGENINCSIIKLLLTQYFRTIGSASSWDNIKI